MYSLVKISNRREIKKTNENKICYYCDKIVYIHGTSLICYELKLLKWIPAIKDVDTAGLEQADITDIKKTFKYRVFVW